MSGIYQRGRYGRYIHRIQTAIDFIIINVAFWVTSVMSPSLIDERGRTVWLLANVAYIPVAYWLGSTHKTRSIQMQHVVVNSLRAVAAHALLFISCLYFVGIDTVNWLAFLEFYGLCFIALPLWWTLSRLIIKLYRKTGHNFSRVVIIGTNPTATRLGEELNSDMGFGYKIMGFCDYSCLSRKQRLCAPFIPMDQLGSFVRDNAIDEIFYTLSGEDTEAMSRAISIADELMVRFYYVPQINQYVKRGFNYTAIGSMPVMAIRPNPLHSITNRLIKRTTDILISGIVMIMSPLVIIPVGIAIKISSSGPIFFKQKRTGYKGREFNCYKFRTMKVNKEADTIQATKNDPRKTRLGNFLRKTSIDELPQFLNVLKGDMSVVGPRPHMLKHTKEYSALIDKYMVRHMIKPGITGWAQIHGYRGQTEELWQMEKRVEYDVWYLEHWSFMLDMKIIVCTAWNAIRGEKNAF